MNSPSKFPRPIKILFPLTKINIYKIDSSNQSGIFSKIDKNRTIQVQQRKDEIINIVLSRHDNLRMNHY